MQDAEVILRDAPVVPPSGDKPNGGKDKETVTLTRAEVESMRRERDEANESAKYWERSARPAAARTAAVEAEPEIDTEDLLAEATGNADVDEAIYNDPDKWAEAISKGPKAIEAFIEKAGYVKRAEVVAIASKAALRTVALEKTRMQGDAAIIGEFPALNDNKSELFKATTAEVQNMVRMDPNAAKSPATLYAAAKVAQLKLDAKAASTRRAPDDETDDERYDRVEREDDRRSRSDAQDTSRNRGRSSADDSNDMLGDQAKEVLRQMGGITDDEFRAERAKLGPRSRRR